MAGGSLYRDHTPYIQVFVNTNANDMRKKADQLKIFLFIWASLFCRAGVWAQASAGSVEYRNVMQPAVAIRLPYSAGPVEDALKDYMTRKGFKAVEISGFILFRGVPLSSADTALNDLYFKTDGVRKDKDMTVLNLVPAKKSQDMSVRALPDSGCLDRARLFLDSLAPFVNAYGTRLQASNQQTALQKAQKKMNSLLNDQTDLEKRLRAADRLAIEAYQQALQSAELEPERRFLAARLAELS